MGPLLTDATPAQGLQLRDTNPTNALCRVFGSVCIGRCRRGLGIASRGRHQLIRVRYPSRVTPLFADDNSSYRRAMRRAQAEERRREVRRAEILDTLRRLRDTAGDPQHEAAEERSRRHREMLERYPPLY